MILAGRRSRDMIQADIRALEMRRREAVDELLSREYYPALAELRKECGVLGHYKAREQVNFVGTRRWNICGYCGASFDETEI